MLKLLSFDYFSSDIAILHLLWTGKKLCQEDFYQRHRRIGIGGGGGRAGGRWQLSPKAKRCPNILRIERRTISKCRERAVCPVSHAVDFVKQATATYSGTYMN